LIHFFYLKKSADRLAIEKAGEVDIVPSIRQVGRTLKKTPALQWCSSATA
jgi:hypothetical protein